MEPNELPEDPGPAPVGDSPIVLHAMPLVCAGVTVLASHTSWGLPPMYSERAVVEATPGATYDQRSMLAELGHPVEVPFYTGDLMGAEAAAFLLTRRLVQLKVIDRTKHLEELISDYEAMTRENNKRIQDFIRLLPLTYRTWSAVAAVIGDGSLVYDGPVARPSWGAPTR